MPAEIQNRDADISELLFIVAELAAENWLDRVSVAVNGRN